MISINVYALIAIVLFILLFFACVIIAVLLEESKDKDKVIKRRECDGNGRENLCDRRCSW